MSDEPIAAESKTPTVYFIDDSATMREVIKIAFRKENIHVITCPDAASAIAQFAETAPDAVITDVIMPDRDGYEVCEFVKRQEQFAKTPVILMSGIVNREVAERAMAVKADELIRKPFQPQELIARVKKLLNPQSSTVIRPAEDDASSVGTEAANPLRGHRRKCNPPWHRQASLRRRRRNHRVSAQRNCHHQRVQRRTYPSRKLGKQFLGPRTVESPPAASKPLRRWPQVHHTKPPRPRC